jgi:hypothetical protein
MQCGLEFGYKISICFLFKQPTRHTNYLNLFSYKTLHVSGIFFAHHQEFSTVHSALVSFMQVLMTASKQNQDGTGCTWKRWSKLTWNLPVPNVQWKTPDDEQRRCPKHVEFYKRINLDNQCVWLVIFKKKSITMQYGNMNVKFNVCCTTE